MLGNISNLLRTELMLLLSLLMLFKRNIVTGIGGTVFLKNLNFGNNFLFPWGICLDSLSEFSYSRNIIYC